ncbi:MAG: hypothetical protein HYS14_07365 [Candidatus Rokubacteria bacterium]|nr:hypothetical protein [Candidatus Rokubacteria bacterium]
MHLRETVDALRRLGHAVQVFSPDTSPEESGVQWNDWCSIPLNGFAGDLVSTRKFLDFRGLLHAKDFDGFLRQATTPA